MMRVMEGTSLLVMIVLGGYVSVSDIRTGRIPNRVLAVTAVYAVVSDFVQYGIVAADLRMLFLGNMAALVGIALFLHYTHAWAGGDCKLLCVFGLLYPAECYFSYQEQAITLAFAVGIAFLMGYLYLVGIYIRSLWKKEIHISLQRLKKGILAFLTSYFRTLLYLTAIHLLYSAVGLNLPMMNTLVWLIFDICIAWAVGSVRFLRNPVLCLAVFGIDVALLVLLKACPLSSGISSYILVLFVVLMKILLTEQNYQIIPTAEVKAGMILSTATTLLFLQSRVKGLPVLSTEDLRSRLTQQEAESVRRWAYSAKGKSQVCIVRKIPFAIFIFLGFVFYFVIWSVVK